MKTFKHKKTGEIATYKDGVLTSSGFSVEIGVEPSSEFWDEITKKDYEILSYIDISLLIKKNDGLFYRENTITKGVREDQISHFRIHSVRRLSDNEIFTIGDKVINPAKLGFTISEFYLDCNKEKLLANGDKTGNGHISINKINKSKLLFTTEDNVNIFEGDRYYTVRNFDFSIAHDGNGFDAKGKKFSTKESAEDYVLINRPCLSIKDITPIIGQCNNTTYVDLDLLTEKLKKLVKYKV